MTSMLFRTLYAKLSVTLLLLTLILTLLLLAISHRVSDSYSQEITQKLNQNIAMYVTEQQQLIDDGAVDTAAIDELAHRMMTINPTVEVYVVDIDGRILAHVLPDESIVRTDVELSPIRRFLSGEEVLPITGSDPRHEDIRKVFSASPIIDEGQTVGYLYAVLGGEKFESLQNMVEESYILRIGTVGIVGSLGVALLAGTIVFFVLTRRLVKLRNDVEAFQASDPDDDIAFTAPTTLNDEIDQLSTAFQAMATHIRQQFKALQSLDATRRELIANVSHDLRTPLASMQGYLETLIIKDNELSDRDRITYLKTAHKHSQRLNDLIGELFELAKLDSGAMELKTEPFSLLELVHDCVQDFQLQAREKDIRLSVDSVSQSCFVNADIGLIQRVLQNLLDNALRHTPKGHSVSISISDNSHRALIEVSDTGKGIAQHEIPHIFERYYYSPPEEPSEKLGSGLGLAIVKRILELHESTIQVTSELNRGTRFTFDLPLQAA